MRATQTEIVDRLTPDQRSGNISTGSYTIVTSSSIIRSVMVKNPKRGPFANANQNTYLQMSINGGTKWTTIDRGGWVNVDGRPTDDTVYITSNTNGAGYEAILLVEDTGGE